MPERMTWVGIDKCGHAGYFSSEPSEHIRSRPEDELETYKSLLDDLRHYAIVGQIRLVNSAEMSELIKDFMCKCHNG